jgi:hypothetical protein
VLVTGAGPLPFMSYRRPIRFAEGEILRACDVCGFPYLYPSELERGSDRLLYCTRTCWMGKTALDQQRESAAFKPSKEQPPPGFGRVPDWYED